MLITKQNKISNKNKDAVYWTTSLFYIYFGTYNQSFITKYTYNYCNELMLFHHINNALYKIWITCQTLHYAHRNHT